MLESGFRAAHEPERAELLDAVVAFDSGRTDSAEFDRYLRARDGSLGLEFDSSWANYFVMERLATLFPDAKFIQLIRDCYTWVESVINHLITRTIPADVQSFLDWWFEPSKYPYQRSDRGLEEIGVYSLDCFVTRWSIHAEGPPQVIPPDRLMTIRTSEIRTSAQRLADFLGTSGDLINTTQSHRNKGETVRPLLGLVDKAYLDDTVARICRESMKRYFPELRNSDDTSLAR